ncbi:MAG: hypothetical protein IPI66_06500 [Chitinophagaceae bacterium]|nr:hypothetical protein [Chitinophagaceae bacterium]MBL0055966.1 hypothetical protein [Chitinophagaceae bacterium]
MKQWSALSLLLFLFSSVLARDPAVQDTVDIGGIGNSIRITSSTLLYIDPSGSLRPEEAVNKTFSPLDQFKGKRAIPPAMVPYTFFLKINLANSADTVMEAFLYPGALFSKISLYKSGGSLTALSYPEDRDGYRKFRLAPHEQTTLLVMLRPVKHENDFFNVQLIKGSFIQNHKLINLYTRSGIKTFGYVLSGILFMMILFMGSTYLLSKKREFLYNAVYSFCMFLLIYFNSLVLRTYTLFTNFFMSYLDFFLLVTGTIFYIAFTRRFLNTETRYGLLDRMLKYGQVFLVTTLVLYTGLHFLTTNFLWQFILENIIKFLSLLLGVFFIIMAVRQKNRLLNYLAAGNAALVLFSTLSLALIWLDNRPSGLFSSPLFYYYLGIVLELSFFLLGLTYKNRNELIERTQEQEELKLQAKKQEYETQIAIMKAQQEERNRISADMHDDLGAGVTTIRLYSELARQKLGADSIPELDKISSSSDELLNKMNAIIWSMSSSNDSLGNMIAYIRSYTIEYFENSGVNCRISIPENLPDILVPGEIRRNVFLVVKEAMNNILKHAKATEVKVTLERVPGGLTLYIHDNGIGINPDKLRQFGNGLKNMKKRMKDIQVQFTIENRNGTLITIHRLIRAFNPDAQSPDPA